MAEEHSKNKINIGISSLILIFIVLCLGTFSLLSLSSAKADLSLAERSAQSVKEYYRADKEGQQWVEKTDAVLLEEMKKRGDKTELSARLKERLGENYDPESGKVMTDIPMERGQSLHIELILTGDETRYQCTSWYVYDSGEYAIDQDMPVWDGAGA